MPSECNCSLGGLQGVCSNLTEVFTLDMHNGTHCTLTGVWYILGLEKNLIYVRSLELQGYGLSLKGGVVRVTCKGQVIMRSIWIDG